MRPKTSTAAAVLAAAAVAGCPATASAQGARAVARGDSGFVLRSSQAPTSGRRHPAKRLRRLIDRVRARHGLPRLRPERHLARAARRHSADMQRRGYFAHDSPDGATPAERMAAAGYRGAIIVSETIAWGTGSSGRPGSLVRAWMGSPPHREILLSPRLREIGVGVTRAGGQAWATADFGARR
jgi:uncharacterized protein YkwD